MYMDSPVAAGIATVLLMVMFLVGVGVFIYKDANKHKSTPELVDTHKDADKA